MCVCTLPTHSVVLLYDSSSHFPLPLWSVYLLARQFCAQWHVAYYSVPCSRVAGVMCTQQLPHSHSSGEVLPQMSSLPVKPPPSHQQGTRDMHCLDQLLVQITTLSSPSLISPQTCTATMMNWTSSIVSTAFQVYIQPVVHPASCTQCGWLMSSVVLVNYNYN